MSGSTQRFRVKRIDDLEIVGPSILAESDMMSPFVWRLPGGTFGVLIRVVPRPGANDPVTGRIWFGESQDGLRFEMDEEPVLAPDEGDLDSCGCEDPTVVPLENELIVYYTGVCAEDKNALLWARGPDVHHLEKQGLALSGLQGQRNAKEAEIGYRDGRWVLGYEFAQDGASSIGVASGDGPAGPWKRINREFTVRSDHWDSHHLSPGPHLLDREGGHVMFYNGASKDAVWAIGWVAFNPDTHEILERSDEPLIDPPREEDGRAMSFAASAVDDQDRPFLYFSRNDRSMHRAVLEVGTNSDKETDR